jgi:aminopeptidase
VTDSRLQRYAELVARFAANVGEGQIVVVNALVEHAPLVRAVTRAAYQAGARWVGTRYSDAHVRRALIELAPEDSLSWTPPWALTELETLAKEDGALISITGPTCWPTSTAGAWDGPALWPWSRRCTSCRIAT